MTVNVKYCPIYTKTIIRWLHSAWLNLLPRCFAHSLLRNKISAVKFGRVTFWKQLSIGLFPSTVLISYLSKVIANIVLISFTAKNLPGLKFSGLEILVIPKMFSRPKCQIIRVRVHPVELWLISVLFSQFIESKSVKLGWFFIDTFILMDCTDGNSKKRPHWNSYTIWKCKRFQHCTRGPNFCQIVQIVEIPEVKWCRRVDSLRKESSLRIFDTVLFFHPSRATRDLTSSRNGAIYSGWAARSYSACV